MFSGCQAVAFVGTRRSPNPACAATCSPPPLYTPFSHCACLQSITSVSAYAPAHTHTHTHTESPCLAFPSLSFPHCFCWKLYTTTTTNSKRKSLVSFFCSFSCHLFRTACTVLCRVLSLPAISTKVDEPEFKVPTCSPPLPLPLFLPSCCRVLLSRSLPMPVGGFSLSQCWGEGVLPFDCSCHFVITFFRVFHLEC